VLRLDKPESQRLGLDRERERAIVATAAAAGLTIPYRVFDLERGYCLRPFVEGQALASSDLDSDTLAQLAALLRLLHSQPAGGRPFDPVAAARRYAAQLATAAAFRLAGQAADLYAAIPPATARAALCHNDLVSSNVLRIAGGGLLLIDWEYAAPGDPWFDLAVVVRHHELGPGPAQAFLAAWLERAPQAAELERLARYCDFYAILLELWNLRVHEL